MEDAMSQLVIKLVRQLLQCVEDSLHIPLAGKVSSGGAVQLAICSLLPSLQQECDHNLRDWHLVNSKWLASDQI